MYSRIPKIEKKIKKLNENKALGAHIAVGGLIIAAAIITGALTAGGLPLAFIVVGSCIGGLMITGGTGWFGYNDKKLKQAEVGLEDLNPKQQTQKMNTTDGYLKNCRSISEAQSRKRKPQHQQSEIKPPVSQPAQRIENNRVNDNKEVGLIRSFLSFFSCCKPKTNDGETSPTYQVKKVMTSQNRKKV
jgi:hypothetical protein